MARGIKKHLKRLNAPKHWMLDKLGGIFAPKPSAGPHKLRECLPLLLVVRNRLKFALNGRECQHILMQRLIKVDGKVRTDMKYPAGFMDVITIENADQHYRLLYDTKGRFVTHAISAEEAQYKLCKVKRKHTGKGNVPYLATHDGRTIRYPDPDIKVNDTILYNLVSGKVERIVKFEVGNMCMLTGGANNGRVGHIVHREKHKGSFEIIHIKDSAGRKFATRINNVFVIGQQNQALVSLPKGKGFKLSILQEQAQRFGSILTDEAQEE